MQPYENLEYLSFLFCFSRKQVRELGKFFTFSFLWGFFQWFYTAGDDCGFASFPSLGLKAYKYKYTYIITLRFPLNKISIYFMQRRIFAFDKNFASTKPCSHLLMLRLMRNLDCSADFILISQQHMLELA